MRNLIFWELLIGFRTERALKYHKDINFGHEMLNRGKIDLYLNTETRNDNNFVS